MELYILCPVHCYNVWQHVKDKSNNNNIYFPQSLSAEHTTLSLMLPAQKNLYLMVESNTENIKGLKDNFENNMEQLSKQMNNLASRIEKIEKDKITEKIQQKKLELTLKSAESYKSNYLSYDPMIFAVKKGTSILSDKNALAKVGVCWGDDMSQVMLELNEISVKNTQKKMRDTIKILLES